jgi:hypothetical protein
MIVDVMMITVPYRNTTAGCVEAPPSPQPAQHPVLYGCVSASETDGRSGFDDCVILQMSLYPRVIPGRWDLAHCGLLPSGTNGSGDAEFHSAMMPLM